MGGLNGGFRGLSSPRRRSATEASMLHHQPFDTNRLSRNTVYLGDPSVFRSCVERGGRPAIEGACPTMRHVSENPDVPHHDIVVGARLSFCPNYPRAHFLLALRHI